jgi:hypothetical protein
VAKVSLNQRGLISISDGGVRRYGLEKYDYAVLYYDEIDKIVVIEPVTAKIEGAMKLRKRDTGAYIAAQSYVGRFQIELPRTTTYDLLRDKDSGMIYFELKKGRQRAASDPSGDDDTESEDEEVD